MLVVFREFISQSAQFVEATLDVAKVLPEQFLEVLEHGLGRTGQRVDGAQVLDLGQAEPELLQSANETKPLDFVGAEDPAPRLPPANARKQSQFFVVADRPGGQARGLGRLANAEDVAVVSLRGGTRGRGGHRCLSGRDGSCTGSGQIPVDVNWQSSPAAASGQAPTAAAPGAATVAPVTAKAAGHAFPRAGLLGNPSDIYGGKALAFAFENFRASVQIHAMPPSSIPESDTETLDVPDFMRLAAPPQHPDFDGVHPLLLAACRRFRHGVPGLDLQGSRRRFQVTWKTDIPRQVGLAGSSALVIAALRALAQWFRVELPPLRLATLALEAETEELGITAGPMDRIAQAFEGLLLMDFNEALPETGVTRIAPELLPPLFVAWDPGGGEASGRVHADVRARWLAGDPDLRKGIAIFPAVVDDGMACLARGHRGGFRAAIDRNFDTRAAIWPIGKRDRQMIEIARKQGAGAKFCGSGGAVVGCLEHGDRFGDLKKTYGEAGFQAIAPRLYPDTGGHSR